MDQSLPTKVAPGCIIEFMSDKAPQIAWVLEEMPGKLRVLFHKRKETTIQINRVLPWIGPSYQNIKSKDAAIDILEQHQTIRKEQIKIFHPIELWELSQGEVIQASANWFCELVITNPDIDTIAACGHSLLACTTHFKFQPPNFEVYLPQIVEKRIKEQETALQRNIFIHEGNTFLQYLWELYTQKKVLPLNAETIPTQFAEQVRQMLFDQINNPEHSDNTLWRTLIKGIPDDPFLALYLLEAWGILKPHHNFWLDRASYDATEEWNIPYNPNIELMVIKNNSQNYSCIQLPFISIDTATTKDIDDAFFVKEQNNGWELIVTLACPALHWPFGEPLDLAVRHRATSLYLPEATYNMLPTILATDTYSLRAHNTRPALVVTCFISNEGIVQNCTPSFGYVSLASNLTYNDCEYVLEGGTSKASPYAEQLHRAFQLAQTYQKYRLQQGAVIVERHEPDIQLSSENDSITVSIVENIPSPKAHLLVSELMIIVNTALASWASECSVPLFYRTQDISIPRQFTGKWTDPQDIAKVVKVLTPAVLEIEPRPHAGLGVKRYAPSTSPLRRYPDMINEAQILHVLHHGNIRWSQQELQAMLPYINTRLDYVGQIQRFRQRYWKLLYFLQQGKILWWTGIITEITEHYVTVTLPKEQIYLRGRRSLFTTFLRLGQYIQIRVGNIRPLYNEIHIIETQEI